MVNMILTFSRQSFVHSIIFGRKIHTIREDKTNRWKVGMKIHFWSGNPRNVKKHPYQFGLGMVKEVLPIEIYPSQNMVKINRNSIESTITEIKLLNRLAINDGFLGWEDMKKWFKFDFKGKIIIWNNGGLR